MANEVDPHELIAVMYLAYRGGRQNDFPRRLDPTGRTLVAGITENHETNIRTIPVLDALASIAVCEEKHKVYATALQLDRGNRKIRLVIAGNKGVEDVVVEHLTNIWTKLRDLSNEYAKNRGGDPSAGVEKPPDMPAKIGIPLKVAIFREVYLFSQAKHLGRMRKWKDDFVLFMRAFGKSFKVDELSGLTLKLQKTATPLLLLLKELDQLPQKHFTEAQWVKMLNYSITVNQGVQRIFSDTFFCEFLAIELKDRYRDGRVFQLRSALGKLTSLFRTIDALFSFAHSPRLRPALLFEMSISRVPDQTRTVELPQTYEGWLSVLQRVSNKPYDSQSEMAIKLAKDVSPGVFHVHCECALIHHLQANDGTSWDAVPSFNYIGVSKLSCSACHLWVEAFNDQNRREFFTRGSCGKFYWHWVMPEGEALKKSFVEKVSKLYIAYLVEELRRSKAESYSSDPDTAGAQPRLDADQEKFVESQITKDVSEFGDEMDFYANLPN